MVKLTLSLIFLLAVNPTFAGKKPALSNHRELELKLSKLKSGISNTEAEIQNLIGDIGKLEVSLGKGNRHYLKVLRKKRGVEAQLFSLRHDLMDHQKEIENESKEIKSVVRSLLVNTYDKNSAEDLAASKVLTKIFVKKLKELKKDKKVVINLQDNLKSLEGRYNEYSKVETELSDLIATLESQKKHKAENYLLVVKKRDDLKIKFRKTKKTSAQWNSRFSEGKGFMAPIDEFSKVSYGKKGVTYHFRGRRPVIGTGKGRITYSGRLGAYGNVIMIDHGKDTRSVIFGRFNSRVKKGDSVQKGQVLGYTDSSSGGQGQVHFEIRKKSKVQKTIDFIDKKIIASNGYTSKRI